MIKSSISLSFLLPYVFIATLFVAVGCSVFQGYRDDNAVEEMVEEVIAQKTGLETDITPSSPEK